MKSLADAIQPEAPMEEEGAPVMSEEQMISGTDAEIAANVGTVILNQPAGIDLVSQAFSESEDPSLIVGTILVEIIQASTDLLAEKGLEIDPRAWMSKDGAIEKLIDEVDRIANMSGFDVPDEVKDDIFMDVAELIKAKFQEEQMAMEQPPQEEMGPPQGGQPPMPMMGG